MNGTAGGIEERLRRLEDIQEITTLFMSYRRTLDERDFAAYSQLFAPAGEWTGNLGTSKGPAAIEKMLDDTAGQGFAIASGEDYHLVANPDIHVDGDRATATSTWVFVTRDGDDRPKLSLMGHYKDDLHRTPEGWRFLRREAFCDMPAEHLGVRQ
ncbi:MAG TPA: nuclear transport factor 2 family protein [Gaiellales bacterium]